MSFDPNFSKTVAAMSNEDLCALAGELWQDHIENEPSSVKLGFCLVEQADRFARMIAAARQDGHRTGCPGHEARPPVPRSAADFEKTEIIDN